ncbi:hypothetical protein FHT76_008214 [Rhizobium sp. BK176]|nr:hypothetical protein [Rhizobium sp. BK181]MBB3544758.1 hypothetical protein [Rhizobium sp. BK399]MCS4096492.1 hypothetical protein [Rhizobium sp. BK176]
MSTTASRTQGGFSAPELAASIQVAMDALAPVH